MTGDDYGQAFHDGETTGRAEERRDVIAYILNFVEVGAEGVNTLNYIADAIGRGYHAGHFARRASEKESEAK